MSAIWGIIDISKKRNIDSARMDEIRATFEKKCVLDNLFELRQNFAYMGIGMQYVTKESQLEKLPKYDENSKTYFVADCILNDKEKLAEELNEDMGMPDGELIYKSYLKWGIDFPKYVLGQYAVVIYEAEKGRVYLVSDHIASRCLYYGVLDGYLVFSTLLEPIKSAFKLEINENYIKDYLIAPYLMPCFTETETYYKGINKLSTAKIVSLAVGDISESTYWDPRLIKRPFFHKGAKAFGKEFVALYEKCVKDALRTDGNVGISMSSGLDSSSIGALAARNLAQENKKLFTYTYVPGELLKEERHNNIILNETKDVMSIVDMYPNMVPHFVNNEDRNSVMEIEKVMDFMEFPVKAFVNFPNLYEIMSKAHTDNGCKVVLTGQGGNMNVSMGQPDDIQYDLYLRKRYLKLILNLNSFCKKTGTSRKNTFSGLFRDYKRYHEAVLKPDKSTVPITNPFVKENILDGYSVEERCPNIYRFNIPVSYLAGHEYMKFNFNVSSLVYIGEYETKLGLATGVMIRDATRDKRIFDFCAKLPYEYFYHNGTPRWLINGNFSGILPERIISNYIRYGFQNADFIDRVNRDKEEVVGYLKGVIEKAPKVSYVDWDKVNECLCDIENTERIEDENLLSFLVYICIICLKAT